MSGPHIHAVLIKLWADGADIQTRNPNGPSPAWRGISNPSWFHNHEYRVKPQNLIGFVPFTEHGRGDTYPLKETALKQTMAKHVLRVEIDPGTMQVVSATVEGP